MPAATGVGSKLRSVPEYKLTVVDPGNTLDPGISWKRYRSEAPLEYGSEIVIEPETEIPGVPGSLRVRVTGVDNDAFFTSEATVEPIVDA
jgi:hypothetical protein